MALAGHVSRRHVIGSLAATSVMPLSPISALAASMTSRFLQMLRCSCQLLPIATMGQMRRQMNVRCRGISGIAKFTYDAMCHVWTPV